MAAAGSPGDDVTSDAHRALAVGCGPTDVALTSRWTSPDRTCSPTELSDPS